MHQLGIYETTIPFDSLQPTKKSDPSPYTPHLLYALDTQLYTDIHGIIEAKRDCDDQNGKTRKKLIGYYAMLALSTQSGQEMMMIHL